MFLTRTTTFSAKMLLFLFFSVSLFLHQMCWRTFVQYEQTQRKLFLFIMTEKLCCSTLHQLFVASSSSSGFERRPLKHPSCPDGTERDPPKPPRTGTVPALVPKPPSYPLVKLVGKFYTLKCRWVNCVCWSRTRAREQTLTLENWRQQHL